MKHERDIIDFARGFLGGIDFEPHWLAGDALAVPWMGKVYLKPPYDRTMAAWLEKLADAYVTGLIPEALALIPARTDTQWWKIITPYQVCFIRGRVVFEGQKAGAPFPSALVYLGPDKWRFAEACELGPMGWGRGLGTVWEAGK